MSVKSCAKYFCASLVAIIAILFGIVLNLKTKPDNVVIDLSSSSNAATSFSPLDLTGEQVETYHRDGVLFVPGLLSKQEATRVGNAIHDMIPRASLSIFDLVATSNYAKVLFDLWRTDETIAKLSLQSLPKLASFLRVGSTNDKIRLLRDAYFSYEVGGKGCGWHVDDEGFWPAEEDTTGVTVWIALDEMKVSEGGGLAVANGTHILNEENSWINDCREVIKGNTCAMATISPECHAKLEDIKLEWDMEPGDAILWDRWAFHRTVVAVAKNTTLDETNHDKPTQRRYSVRYMPSNAKAMGAVHHSVAQGSNFESPYYPQVWPTLIHEEVLALKHGLEGDVTPTNIVKTLFGMLTQKVFGG